MFNDDIERRFRAVGSYVYAGGYARGTRDAGFDVVAHLEGDGGYGASSAQLNWPDLPIYHGPANWPRAALRESGVDYVFANPPCFAPNTRVMTENGPRRIVDLVRSRSTDHVLSFCDHSDELVYRRITGWHENPYDGEMIDVKMSHVRGVARATVDHRFLTSNRGWVRAADLNEEDLVYSGRFQPNGSQRELITGMMLGDSQIKKHQPQLHVLQTDRDYVTLKRRALAQFVCQDYSIPSAPMEDGVHVRKERYGFYLKTEPWIWRERERWYGSARERIVPRDLYLSDMALAVWYMDDGTLRSVGIYDKNDAGFRGNAVFCTDRYSRADVKFLIEKLAERGIETRIAGKDSKRSIRYPRILVTTNGFKALIDIIAPFIPPSFRYKLPTWASPFEPGLWKLGAGIADVDRVTTRPAPRSKRQHVYCLDVEETHNFVTYGGVAHNCAIFSSMGIATTRGKEAWQTDGRLDHWRDCFDLLEDLAPRAWALESVTNAYTTGREAIDEMTRRALLQGYSVTHLLLDARWTGIPQSRRRFFILAHRPTKLIGYHHNWAPPPTIGEALAEARDDVGWRAEVTPRHRDALVECRPGERLANAWERVNPGFSERERSSRGHVVGRPSFGDRRLNGDEVMGAFIGDKFFHPSEDRKIGINEAKAICGYPLDFQLAPPESGWPSLLARAVMPPVGRWLGRAVIATLGQPDGSWDDRRVTLVDVREPDRPEVDLTASYLDEHGRVRMRVSAAGSTGIFARRPPREPAPVKVIARQPVVPRTVTPIVVPSSDDPTMLLPREGSGAFIQRLWRDTSLSPERIRDLVLLRYEGRRTQVSDVYYNYQKLVKAGERVRGWRETSFLVQGYLDDEP